MKQATAIKNLMARVRRRWHTPATTIDMRLVGGPFAGQQWTCSSAHRYSLPFTAYGMTGRYVSGVWKPADERSA